MKTPYEIGNRCRAGHYLEREVLLPYLPYSEARPFLHAIVTEDDWTAGGRRPQPLDEETIRATVKALVAETWECVRAHEAHRVGPRLVKLTAYLWLLDYDDAAEAINGDAWPWGLFGAPILNAIDAALGHTWEPEAWRTRMLAGDPCCEGCRYCAAALHVAETPDR